MSASQHNGQLGRVLSELRARSYRRKMQRHAVALICAVMLMVLLALVAGCASPPPTPCEPQPKTPPPALHQPPSSVTYSAQLQQKLNDWRERLISGKAPP